MSDSIFLSSSDVVLCAQNEKVKKSSSQKAKTGLIVVSILLIISLFLPVISFNKKIKESVYEGMDDMSMSSSLFSFDEDENDMKNSIRKYLDLSVFEIDDLLSRIAAEEDVSQIVHFAVIAFWVLEILILISALFNKPGFSIVLNLFDCFLMLGAIVYTLIAINDRHLSEILNIGYGSFVHIALNIAVAVYSAKFSSSRFKERVKANKLASQKNKNNFDANKNGSAFPQQNNAPVRQYNPQNAQQGAAPMRRPAPTANGQQGAAPVRNPDFPQDK